MAAAATVPHLSSVTLEEYLSSPYDPDVDFVEGRLEERHVGEFDHQAIQRALLFLLGRNEDSGGYYTALELRTQVAPERFRIPDISVLSAQHLPERYSIVPPLFCIEILSPEDTATPIQIRSADYLRMGVPEVWIIDPTLRNVAVMRSESLIAIHRTGVHQVKDTAIALDIDELFTKAARRPSQS